MASVSIQFTHPQLTRTNTLTVPDAKLLAFADLLIAYQYKGEGVDGADLTRVEAIDRFMEVFMEGIKGKYRQLRQAEIDANAEEPGEIDE